MARPPFGQPPKGKIAPPLSPKIMMKQKRIELENRIVEAMDIINSIKKTGDNYTLEKLYAKLKYLLDSFNYTKAK